LTDVEREELDEFDRKMAEGTLNPRDVKLRMAREIVSEFHNEQEAQEAQEAFIRQFSERKWPTDIPDYPLSLPKGIVEVMVDAKLATSSRNARDLIRQNAVRLSPTGKVSDAVSVSDVDFMVDVMDGAVINVGKLRFIRIKA
jgi:tyrosyl-tRNA synthetase